MSKNTQLAKPPQVVMVVDFGGSSTKIIFAGPDGKLRAFTMEPEVARVTKDAIELYAATKLGAADPENAAWVALKEEYSAVGYLAQFRFHANAGLAELKYERAVEKTLAALWVIKEKLKLGAKFSVALACLLPAGEFKNRERFAAMLKASTANFLTPAGRISVSIELFDCRPEGSGIFLVHRLATLSSFKARVVGVVMVGYRNASVLVSHRGQLGDAVTSDLGFVRMAKSVISRTSGQTPERLTKAIVAAGDSVNSKPLLPLARSTTEAERTKDVAEIVTAIQQSRPEYVATLISWLNNTLPQDVNEIVFCGGTAEYLKKELTAHYTPKVSQVVWNANLRPPKEFHSSDGWNTRYADAYGLYLYFKNQVDKLSISVPEEKAVGVI